MTYRTFSYSYKTGKFIDVEIKVVYSATEVLYDEVHVGIVCWTAQERETHKT